MVLTLSFGGNTAAPDIEGVWLSDLRRSNFGGQAQFNRIILSVTRVGSRLSVVEVNSGEAGKSIAHRRYVVGPTSGRSGNEGCDATSSAGELILRDSHRVERWCLSDGDSSLTVTRTVVVAAGPQVQVLVFQRSETTKDHRVD